MDKQLFWADEEMLSEVCIEGGRREQREGREK